MSIDLARLVNGNSPHSNGYFPITTAPPDSDPDSPNLMQPPDPPPPPHPPGRNGTIPNAPCIPKCLSETARYFAEKQQLRNGDCVDGLHCTPGGAFGGANRRIQTFPPSQGIRNVAFPLPSSLKSPTTAPPVHSPDQWLGSLGEFDCSGAAISLSDPSFHLGVSPISSPPPESPPHDAGGLERPRNCYSDSVIQQVTGILSLEKLKQELSEIVAAAVKGQTAGCLDKDTTGRNGMAPVGAAGYLYPSGGLDSAGCSSPGSEDVITPVSSSESLTPTSQRSPLFPRRHVAFADDRGHILADVRVMTEPSDVPPVITSARVRALIEAEFPSDGEEEQTRGTWELNFTQPACEYMSFRQKLEAQHVALENVVIRQEGQPCRLTGTIKVRNLCFEKEVLVRFTDNNWISYKDFPAAFSGNVPGDVYDTFSFAFEIPYDDDDHQRVEFCVCFRAKEPGQAPKEFWDSNGGQNFALISERVRKLWEIPDHLKHPLVAPGLKDMHAPCSDAYALNMNGHWSDFSTWTHLDQSGPYW